MVSGARRVQGRRRGSTPLSLDRKDRQR
jgi:hypothetical protein